METEETTYVKLVSNNTTTCSRAYCLTVVFWGDVYFTDVDARKIGRLTGGSAAEYVFGSGEETPKKLHRLFNRQVYVLREARCM